MKKVHYYSGLFITLFITLHLTNHLCALIGPEKHMEIMKVARLFYQNALIEPLLILACLIQIIAGISLFCNKKKDLKDNFDRLHIYSGLYLAFFLTVHTSAIFAGRYYFQVDTNFWFGASVVNIFPLYFFYGPYYFLGIFSFFAHVACIHRSKVRDLGWKVNWDRHAKIILWLGAIVGFLILAGFTGFFQGLTLPDEYLNLYL